MLYSFKRNVTAWLLWQKSNARHMLWYRVMLVPVQTAQPLKLLAKNRSQRGQLPATNAVEPKSLLAMMTR